MMFLRTGPEPDAIRQRIAPAIFALAVFGAAGIVTVAFAQSEAQVKAGLEVWKSAGCPDCGASSTTSTSRSAWRSRSTRRTTSCARG